jgi:murein DD-endopeptidase MepM/ murein hydrolase activator NlpD
VFIVGLVGALAGVWIDREGTYRELAAERFDIQQREMAFRSYADATRHLLEEDNTQILTELAQLRLDQGQGFGDAFRTRLAGGTDDASPVLGVLQTRLDNQQQEVLLQNLELREFLSNLPSVSPLEEMRLVSGFGIRRHPIFRSMQHHAGLDFVTDGDPTIRASQAGVISQAGRNGGYGLTVEITSDFGVVTRYAHLRQIDVLPGQRVAAGQGIGVMGSTGLSTGPHLHYEILVNGVQVDPTKVFGLSRNALEKAD